ncbi:MAG: bi-domain-containing oxidoreductase [Saprospiraceae bacterium]|nr:bi-domain-containing oxidoreductase [Saprospiraceae bacterium]
MKLLMQSLKSGETFFEEIPKPAAGKNFVLVESVCSLVSPGTERMLVHFGKSNWIQKIAQQPEKFKQVVQKIQTDGLLNTYKAVEAKLDQAIPLGYSNVGIIREIGAGVHEFKIGDRVVCNGFHAEYNIISKNLCARIPDSVSNEDAAMTLLAAIALQGIRLADVELGERVVVMGLGLIGLLACQILKASGCEVIGMDVSDDSIELARQLGIRSLNSSIHKSGELFQSEFKGIGADAVIITASAKQDLINDAAALCRIRGRIILIGLVGNEISRDLFYKKELTFQVACSYGPGRYDPDYEDKAIDYPIGFVRWTEKSNMEAILQLMEQGQLQLSPLVKQRVSFDQVIQSYYMNLDQLKYANLIDYQTESPLKDRQTIFLNSDQDRKGPFRIGVIGSGNFCSSIILPELKKFPVELITLCSSRPNAGQLAKKFGFQNISSELDAVILNPDINLVIIANRHHAHASLIIKCLEAGKQVFVEKPLCILREDLKKIQTSYNGNSRLAVGYNRRFAPSITKICNLIKGVENQLSINYVINAGYIDPKHWVQDPEIGGGRILGEVCHFIDLCNFLTKSNVIALNTISMGTETNSQLADTLSIQLKYANGSMATIQYLGNGSKQLEKETIQVFFTNKVIELHNFKRIRNFGLRSPVHLFQTQDKGYYHQFKELLNPESDYFNNSYFEEVCHVSTLCFDIIDQLQGKNQ